ncbi:MAG: DUF433 domain-containing protein [Gemmatimonadales bacterium]|nr:DUF433 domain-containing protein [Gemmatimonadales bacterium]MDZ4389267.1 DUF433 domain-containing protein [Gemmatimonadales bacterium]
MTWTEHITTDPAALGGQPVVKGTRLAVDFVSGLLTEGWTRDQLLANYPQLTDEALQAIREALAEGQDEVDLAAFRDRENEPTLAFEDFLRDMKRRGKS